MKFKRILLSVATLLFVFAGAAASACNMIGNEQDVQQLNYTESTEKINNPDQGFYRPIYVKVTESGVTYNKNIVTSSTQLYHLRIDISEFSKAVNGTTDKALTDAALDGIDELLYFLNSSDKNAVVRLAYDPSYGGAKDKEPDLSVMLKHIEQVCPVLNGYKNTITAVEAGLIGPWGEMHSSAIANSASITEIIESFLSNTEDFPVLVRTPKMIYDYLGITVNEIDNLTIEKTDKAYRLGIFNDGYLGSDSDLGTYTDREKDTDFLSAQTSHLPYGGEVVTPASSLHDIDKCLPEMNKLNLSYLNVEWDNNVIDKWKNSNYTNACGDDKAYYGKTAYEYIENHMGYRFVLTKSVFDYSEGNDTLAVKLTLNNVGFGNLNRIKLTKLIFVNGGEVVAERSAGDFTGGSAFNCSAQLDLESGTYDVFLRIYGEESGGVSKYCLQFANDGLWNETLKANKIGSVDVN